MRFIKNLLEFITINRSGLFDPDYYIRTYPDVQRTYKNPIMHYIKIGWREGKNPSANFDTIYYLRENTDVRHARTNPLVHFIKFGQAEERPPNKRLSKNPCTYSNWIDQYDTLTPEDTTKIKEHIKALNRTPLISILMPVYNTNEAFLREALDSVLAQCYPNWECCIADDASTNPRIREILQSYAKKDSRIKVVFRETNGHISGASNSALALAKGEYIGLLDHDDVLREHALYMVVNEINRYPNGKMFYSDEDLTDEFNVRYEPYFKPDWNPDLFCGQNLISHFCVYGADEVRQVGGFREGYEGAQDWDLAMRISEIIPASSIRHIPFILYHWRASTGSTALSSIYKDYAKNAQYLTITSHYERIGRSVEVTFTDNGQWKLRHNIADPKPLTSIIIPTRNQALLLQKCIENLLSKTQYPNYEILIVNNQSDEAETLKYLDQVGENKSITILDYDYPFNYSAINNFAADFANGEVLIFLNNDIEVISPDWLDEMVGHAIRPEIGAVGAMLYYPNDTIQHAGVVMGMKGVAGHIHYGSPRGTIGQRGRACLAQNYSAVTTACMAISKEKFFEVGGFDSEHLPIAYNDIDLCLRLIKAGYRNLWTPHAELYHHESQSRDYENTPEKIARVKYEADYLVNKWPEMIAHDPAYNPNLSLTIPDFSPAFPPRTIKPWIKISKHT
jgi:glycosyltransferase involved in cell wall biosynthesis